jgi:hypothetical protein
MSEPAGGWSDLAEKIGDLTEKILEDVWHKYGPFAALLIIFVGFFIWYFNRMWEKRLADKDGEIERLVKDRDRFFDIILKKRLSSKD